MLEDTTNTHIQELGISVGEQGVNQDVCCKVLHVMKQGDISYRTKYCRAERVTGI